MDLRSLIPIIESKGGVSRHPLLEVRKENGKVNKALVETEICFCVCKRQIVGVSIGKINQLDLFYPILIDFFDFHKKQNNIG